MYLYTTNDSIKAFKPVFEYKIIVSIQTQTTKPDFNSIFKGYWCKINYLSVLV